MGTLNADLNVLWHCYQLIKLCFIENCLRVLKCGVKRDEVKYLDWSPFNALCFDWQAISREAKEFELGETRYYVVVVCSAIIWQCFFLGAIGVIYYSSSLLSGIVITVLLPITEILAVIFYHEKFQAEKGISLFLSIWGFISYFYGDIKHNKDTNTNTNTNKNDVGGVNNNGLTAETQLVDQTSIPWSTTSFSWLQ